MYKKIQTKEYQSNRHINLSQSLQVDSSEAVSQVLSGVRPQAKKSEKKAEKSKEKSDKEKKGVMPSSGFCCY